MIPIIILNIVYESDIRRQWRNIYMYIYDAIEHHVINSNQHNFLSNKSATTQLLECLFY